MILTLTILSLVSDLIALCDYKYNLNESHLLKNF